MENIYISILDENSNELVHYFMPFSPNYQKNDVIFITNNYIDCYKLTKELYHKPFRIVKIHHSINKHHYDKGKIIVTANMDIYVEPVDETKEY